MEREKSYLVRLMYVRERAYEKALVRLKTGKGYNERETKRGTASLSREERGKKTANVYVME